MKEGSVRPSDVRPSYEPPLGFAALGESTVVEEELQSQCTPVSSALPSTTTIATMTAASVSYVGDCWLGVWVEGLAFFSDINQGNHHPPPSYPFKRRTTVVVGTRKG